MVQTIKIYSGEFEIYKILKKQKVRQLKNILLTLRVGNNCIVITFSEISWNIVLKNTYETNELQTIRTKNLYKLFSVNRNAVIMERLWFFFAIFIFDRKSLRKKEY